LFWFDWWVCSVGFAKDREWFDLWSDGGDRKWKRLCFLMFCCMWGQVAIPVVPTVRVVVTFTKFVELQPVEQFYTPFSSPSHLLSADDDDDDHNRQKLARQSSSSGASTWLRRSTSSSQSWSKHQQRCSSGALDSDPFAIPAGYTWTNSGDDSSRKMKKSNSMRKSKWILTIQQSI